MSFEILSQNVTQGGEILYLSALDLLMALHLGGSVTIGSTVYRNDAQGEIRSQWEMASDCAEPCVRLWIWPVQAM